MSREMKCLYYTVMCSCSTAKWVSDLSNREIEAEGKAEEGW